MSLRWRLTAGCLVLAAGAGLLLLCYTLLPRLHKADYAALRGAYEESVRLYDRKGTLLREAANSRGERAVWVDYERFPVALVQAVVAAEDERFFSHQGVDWAAVFRALRQNLGGLELQSGASTITMQLARLLDGHPRGWLGKLRQVYGARVLEAGLSKEQILGLYLNRVSVEGGSIGMEAASRALFGSSLPLLSRSQTALLAGLIKGPSAYDPRKNLAGAQGRRDYVLKRQVALGSLTAVEAERARQEPLRFQARQRRPQAMHFTDYALQRLREQGHHRGGDFKTSLDLGLNRQVEALLTTHIEKLRTSGIQDGAVVVLDNRTLEIIGLVGSPDYWAGEKGRNNGVTMRRQPGSTLKPFTYAAAFGRGWSPADVIPDIPVNYLGGEDKLYEPQNYSGRYNGPVTLQDALGRSLNVPAIRLAASIGTSYLLKSLHQFGFDSLSLDASHYGLGLTLGNGEVSLLELVRGYSVFANRGLRRNLSPFLGARSPAARVLSEELSYLVTAILGDEELRAEAFGFDNPLMLEFPMAIKTGTSSNWRDNWVIGYTQDFSVGVWAGDFSGKPTNQYYGAIGAGPLFQQVARAVRASRKDYQGGALWVGLPAAVEELKVCPVSGELPHAHCGRTSQVPVLKALAPARLCGVHRAVEVDVRNGMMATDKVAQRHRSLRVFEYLGPEYQAWLYSQNRLPPPAKRSPLDDKADKYSVVSPRQGEVYIFEPGYDPATQSIELKALVRGAGEGLYWFVNGKPFERAQWPYRSSLPAVPGSYAICLGTETEKSATVSILVR